MKLMLLSVSALALGMAGAASAQSRGNALCVQGATPVVDADLCGPDDGIGVAPTPPDDPDDGCGDGCGDPDEAAKSQALTLKDLQRLGLF